MMKISRIYRLYLLLLCTGANGFLYSCKKDDPGGAAVTKANPAQSVKAYPGKNRVKLTWRLPDPATVEKAVIYWNSRDSITVPYRGTADSMEVMVTGLEEANYSFKIYLHDRNGHTSSMAKIVARAYGDPYAQSLKPRLISSVYYHDADSQLVINWSGQGGDPLGIALRYTHTDGAAGVLYVSPRSDSTVLEDFKPSTTLSYRTMYLPAPGAIDTFFTERKTQPVATGSLKSIADKKGLLIGSMMSYGAPWANSGGVILDQSPGGVFTALASKEFNLGTATWGAGGRWHQDGTYDFSQVNAVINWCAANHQTIVMHNILGPSNYMPDWFNDGSFSPDQLNTFLKDLIYNFMDSNDNKDKVAVWDVANELFNNDGTYRTNMRWNDMGWEDDASGLSGSAKINDKHPVFIGKALQYCRDRTNALLEIRDYGISNDEPLSNRYRKFEAFYQLIKHLKAKGYPIDCIGIQGHLWIGDERVGGWASLSNTIEKFKQLGVAVNITEMDAAVKEPGQWNATLAKQQESLYYHFIKAALEGGADMINFWLFRDNNDPNWRLDQYPCIYDHDYNRKPAFYGVRSALFEAK